MVKVWEVVGGGDAGGILVRQSKETDSEACSERLSTGALIRELDVDRTRLKYKRISGAGPLVGWVTTQTKSGALVRESELTLQEATKRAAHEIEIARRRDRPATSPADGAGWSRGAAEEPATAGPEPSEARPAAPSGPETSGARPAARRPQVRPWAGSAAPPTAVRPDAGSGAEDILRASFDRPGEVSRAGAREADSPAHDVPQPGAGTSDSRSVASRHSGPADVGVQAAGADEPHEPEGGGEDQVDVVEVERIAREKLEQRMRAAEAAEEAERQLAEEEKDEGAVRKASAPRVYRSCWGDGAEEYDPEVLDLGSIFDGEVQAAWVYDGVLHVVSGGRVGTIASEESWNGKWRDWGKIFHGIVQAAWWCEGQLYVVKQGKVAEGCIVPGGVRWDGSLHDWGHLMRGNVVAAWVEDGGLYVAKRHRGDVEVSVCAWGDQWDGRSERWPLVLDGSCKTAWVDGGFIYVVKEVSETIGDAAAPSLSADRQAH